MTTIKNYKYQNNSISFEINNEKENIKISFVNALRRVLVSHLKCYTINCEETKFIENNSIFNNEFLKARLCLIPIISDKKNVNYNQLMISCKVNNNNEQIKSVYMKDFEIKNYLDGTVYKIEDFCIYPDLLFTKIQENQEIYFEGHLKYSDAFDGGSSHSTVSGCVCTFKNTNESKDKDVLDNQRDYDLNKNGEPNIYEFSFENIGFYKSENLIHSAFEVLIEKVQQLRSKFQNYTYENEYYLFDINDENDTIGNLFSSYLLDESSILYSGYIFEHPLKNNIIFKIKTDKKKEDLLKIMNNNIDKIIKLLKDLEKQFK